jgi:hypothetical protein
MIDIEIPQLEPVARENLVRLAQAYHEHTGIAYSTMGRFAHGTPNFFSDLITLHNRMRGRKRDANTTGSFTARKYDRMMGWFRDEWARRLPDKEFPELIPFPSIEQT